MSNSGFSFNYQIMYPVDFSENKEYDVVFHVYNGPDSQQVSEAWSFDFNKNYLSAIGYVVVYVDTRGKTNSGDDIRFSGYKNLGPIEEADLTEFATTLKNIVKFEINTISLWGWSYGGFVGSHVAGHQNEIWDCVVVVAPKTDSSLFDWLYSEKFMQSKLENGEGYENSKAMNKLDSKKHFTKFTMIHGTADNALHFQNSALMSKRIINQGFEFNNYFIGDGQSLRSRYIPHRYIHNKVDLNNELGSYHKSQIIENAEMLSQRVLKLVVRKLNDCRNGYL